MTVILPIGLFLILLAGWLLAVQLRSILAKRIPVAVVLRKIDLPAPPSALADLFAEVDAELQMQGFVDPTWAVAKYTPALVGIGPPLVRLYHHRRIPIIARVSSPYALEEGDCCAVSYLSLTKIKTVFATVLGSPALFPSMDDSATTHHLHTQMMRTQFQHHRNEMTRQKNNWLGWPNDKRWIDWVLTVVNRYEKNLQNCRIKNNDIKPLQDGSYVPSLATGISYLWRSLHAGKWKPRFEIRPISVRLAAFLYGNWQNTGSLPPAPRVQIGLFLWVFWLILLPLSVFLGWAITGILLGVILLSEFSQWVCMRLAGYRNLQLGLLPLIDGIKLGPGIQSSKLARVYLSSAVPGLLLGWGLLSSVSSNSGWVFQVALILLAVNYFRLLPAIPLAGGNMLRALIPPSKLNVLAGLAGICVIGILAVALIIEVEWIALIALMPLITVITSIKDRDQLEHLSRYSRPNDKKLDKIQAAVAVIEDFDKRYRPLAKKVGNIETLLNNQRNQRNQHASPLAMAGLLSLYLLFFAAPVVFQDQLGLSLQPVKIPSKTPSSTTHAPNAVQIAEEISLKDLLNRIQQQKRAVYEQIEQDSMPIILRIPTSNQTIDKSEKKLQIRFSEDYRRFLKISNGIADEWQGKRKGWGFLVVPVQLVRFLPKAIPELLENMRLNSVDIDATGLVKGLPLDDRTGNSQAYLPRSALKHTLLIGGVPDQREYLLLERLRDRFEYGAVLRISKDFKAIRYPNIEAYLRDLYDAAQAPL